MIGFSQANNAEPYRAHVNDELTAAAAKVPQFTLQIADGAGNVNTQTSQMDNFITQKVDLILISPFEAAPLTPAVARAMKAGIPVIELDRKTVGDPGKDYTAFIGGDNFKIAEEAGKYMADKLLPKGGDVAVLEGLPSSTPAVERLNGFKAGVKANPKIKVVAEQAADWLPDKAQTAFAAMLQAHPDIKAIYASNDMMAAGARLAAKGAGKKDGDIAIIGTDGLPGPSGGIRAVAEGEWAATFTYPTGAPAGDRHGEGDPARLRRQGGDHGDRADARDHARQRQVADGQLGEADLGGVDGVGAPAPSCGGGLGWGVARTWLIAQDGATPLRVLPHKSLRPARASAARVGEEARWADLRRLKQKALGGSERQIAAGLSRPAAFVSARPPAQ